MAIDPSVLDRFDSLEGLGPEGRAEMAPLLQATRYRAGAQICREGDVGEGCYLLVEGEVMVTKALPDGRRVKLATLGPGTLFGQAGLVEGQQRTADVKAVGNVEILALQRRTLLWALGRGAAWAVAMQAIVAVNLVRQLRTALDRLGELAAAEDVTEEISGTKRSDVKTPQRVNASFDGVKARRAGSGGPVADEASPGERSKSLGGLLEMLRSTEASLASAGFDAEAVEFVFDEDQKRTAEARGG